MAHPLRSPFVRALEAPYQAILDGIARARGWTASTDVAEGGRLVARLSRAYNDPREAPPRDDDALAARLLFSFARDVPKGAGAVRELVGSGALSVTGDELRVLDVGAGLGATSRGVVRALAVAGAEGHVVIDAVDADARALDLAASIARQAPREGGLSIDLRPVRGGALPRDSKARYDLVVLGQVLSELDRGVEPAERAGKHAALLQAYAALLTSGGSLVVVEPALRERTRHLHAVRDLALAGSALDVFAPCTHRGPCPILRDEGSWCHEDLDVDLPPWLVPIARAAGLRWQGLTFSYLALRAPDQRESEVDRPRRLRVVSAPVVTKGKRELFLCGRADGAADPVQLRAMRLDRHRTASNAAWDDAARGDVVTLSPPLSASRPRVEGSTSVVLDGPAAPTRTGSPGHARTRAGSA